MNKNNFLNDLLRYYNFSLKIDNVLGTSFSKKDIGAYKTIEQIDKRYEEKLQESSYFYLDTNLKNTFNPIDYANEETINVFMEKLSYFEKTINLERTKLKKAQDPKKINEHDNFCFSSSTNYYQYGIAFNLLKEKPFGSDSTLILSFVVLFPNYDEEFNFLTPEKIFIEIKRFMGYELTDKEKKFSCEIQKYLILNPKILEPYNLKTPNIKLSTFSQVNKEITEFLKPLLESELYTKTNEDLHQNIFIIAISQNFNMGLTKIYDSVFEHKNINTLIKEYFHVHTRKKNDLIIPKIDKDEIITTKKIIDSYSMHFGSFDKTHPLANTQRDAFTCYVQNKNILPVNGAPGTGKTSLLRSIFGDNTVKIAIKSYENYINNKTVNFSPPIVCSSTNNQALTNVSEGIDSGFFQTTQEFNSNLYTRWFSTEIKLQDKVINFHQNLFVPSVKSIAILKYELTKNEMHSIGGLIAKDPLIFLNQYFKFRDVDIICKEVDKRTLEYINKAATFFNEKILKNIKIIEESTKDTKEKVKKLSDFEVYLVDKYTIKGVQEDLIKSTLLEIKNKTQEHSYVFEKLKILQINFKQMKQNNIKIKEEIDTLINDCFRFEKNTANYSNNMETLKDKIPSEKSYIKNYVKSPFYTTAYERTKSKYNDEYNKEVNKIKHTLKNKIKSIFKNSNIFEKIKYGLLKKGSIQQNIDKLDETNKKELFVFTDIFYKQDIFINEVKKSLIDKHTNNIKELKLKLNEIEEIMIEDIIKYSQIKLNLSFLEKDIKFYTLQKNMDEEFGLLSDNVFEFEDIEKLITFRDIYNDVNNLRRTNSKLDTSLRTDNFYYALHLLEALYFIDNANIWNTKIELNRFSNKRINCPICSTGSMVKNDANQVKCSNCNRIFYFNNKYIPKELKESEILYILNYKQATINDISYYTNTNDNFINISTKNNNEKDSFVSLYPIFPLINITCNSFGTIVSNKDNNIIPKDIFDLLLIDEAGTIPPSKMIILNCAKRVIFFGDNEQLKPVFSYDSNIENRILEDFLSSKKDIESVCDYFSCASKIKNEPIIRKNNNAMSVANASCNYFLPYNKSKMQGDIWLKEHFRCQTPIVSIANEISYYNEIIPCKKPVLQQENQKWSTLFFKDHKHEKNSNNTNDGEVNEIIKFIEERKQRYINEFLPIVKTKNATEITDEDYYNSIGIITPFVNQENLLKSKICDKIGKNKENKNEPIIKVGTVHKYQGSEREIIILSSVYNTESIGKTSNFFFNKDQADMINVAVTRAKEVFVLFGNRDALSNPETFSGVMIKHIDKYQKEKKFTPVIYTYLLRLLLFHQFINPWIYKN